jgi:lipopolysaccharide transport system permease protein
VFRLVLSLAVLGVFYVTVRGVPPLSTLSVPLLLALLSLHTAGIVWLVSAVSVYLRDLRHIVIALMPAFMFLTPVFYPVSTLPEMARSLLYANPLTFPIEATRAAMFDGVWPNLLPTGIYAITGWAVALAGYWAFARLRIEFADVL